MDKENIHKYILSMSREADYKKTPITANRVSVMNGMRDITETCSYLVNHYSDIKSLLAEEKQQIPINFLNVMVAECYYQRNKTFKAIMALSESMQLIMWSENYQLLFVALYIQMCVMIVTGQADSIKPIIDGIGEQIQETDNEILRNNFEALKVWCAIYDDDYETIDAWLKNGAPNESVEIKMDDVPRFLTKMRVYLNRKEYQAVMEIAEAMKPVLQNNSRVMDICDLTMLESLAYYLSGNKEEAYDKIREVLEVAEERRFDRLLADEGKTMYLLLSDYKQDRNIQDNYIDNIINMAKEMADMYPNYISAD